MVVTTIKRAIDPRDARIASLEQRVRELEAMDARIKALELGSSMSRVARVMDAEDIMDLVQ